MNFSKKNIILIFILCFVIIVTMVFIVWQYFLNPTDDYVEIFTEESKIENLPIIKKEEEYKEALQKWKDNCLFKPGIYSENDIRYKLGKTNKILYSNENNQIINFQKKNIWSTFKDNEVYKFFYKYKKGLLIDYWYLNNCVVGVTTGERLNKFEGYFDVNLPPIKSK